MKEKLDYKVIFLPASMPPKEKEEHLDKLGTEGWTLITVDRDNYFFKRYLNS